MLDQLIRSHDEHDNSQEYGQDEFFKSFIIPKNVPTKEDGDTMSDTGGSSSYNYGHVRKLESHAHMVRFDQQMMRGLSNNMTEHPLFLSTPRFISDLLFVSEVLKGIEKDERNAYLKQVIEEMNKCLPANVYLPIRQETTNVPERRKKRKGGCQKIGDTQMHRVLRISTDNAFCLHSKERVPYHIIIEVAHDAPVKQDDLDQSVHFDMAKDVNRTQKVKRNDLWAMGKRYKPKRHSGGLRVPNDEVNSPIELEDIKARQRKSVGEEMKDEAGPSQRATLDRLLP